MFYCEECRRQESWPETINVKSEGTCEVCGRRAICHDVPTKLLLNPARFKQVEIELRHNGGGKVLDLIRADAPAAEVEAAMQEFLNKNGAMP